MNTRSVEPRNFWGLTKQIGPWTTTSVDQSHLAQGYDSPHNNRQFVSPYQQDGTATIPDQQYTRISIIEPSADLQFKHGKITKAKKAFGLDIQTQGFLIEKGQVTPQPTVQKILETTRPIISKKRKTVEFMDVDENDSSKVVAEVNSDFIRTNNPAVQSIDQKVQTGNDDFRTMIATNAWTQPAQVKPSSQVSIAENLVSRRTITPAMTGTTRLEDQIGRGEGFATEGFGSRNTRHRVPPPRIGTSDAGIAELIAANAGIFKKPFGAGAG